MWQYNHIDNVLQHGKTGMRWGYTNGAANGKRKAESRTTTTKQGNAAALKPKNDPTGIITRTTTTKQGNAAAIKPKTNYGKSLTSQKPSTIKKGKSMIDKILSKIFTTEITTKQGDAAAITNPKTKYGKKITSKR